MDSSDWFVEAEHVPEQCLEETNKQINHFSKHPQSPLLESSILDSKIWVLKSQQTELYLLFIQSQDIQKVVPELLIHHSVRIKFTNICMLPFLQEWQQTIDTLAFAFFHKYHFQGAIISVFLQRFTVFLLKVGLMVFPLFCKLCVL